VGAVAVCQHSDADGRGDLDQVRDQEREKSKMRNVARNCMGNPATREDVAWTVCEGYSGVDFAREGGRSVDHLFLCAEELD
jgi:hypothetical protein